MNINSIVSLRCATFYIYSRFICKALVDIVSVKLYACRDVAVQDLISLM